MSALDQTSSVVTWSGFNTRTVSIANVAAGASIFVVNCMSNFGTGLTSISCSGVNDGSAYVNDAIAQNAVNSAPQAVELWRLHNVSAGTHNIVLTSSQANSNNFGRIIAFSVTGLQNVAPDVTVANHASSTTPQTGTSAGLSQSGEFVIAAMVLAATDPSPAFTSPANTGYTSLMNIQTTPNLPASADYQHVTATTALSANWGTITGGAEQWTAVLAAYKDVVSGGNPTITSVVDGANPSGTIQQGSTGVTITGTNFGTNTGSAAVTLIDGSNLALTSACPATSWGSTSIQFTVSSGNVRNGSCTIRVTTSGGLQVSLGITLIPATGTAYGNFLTLKALSFDSRNTPSRLNDATDITDGEQWEMTTTAGSGSVTITNDGNASWPTTVTQFAYRHHNGTQWSAVSHWDVRGLFPTNVLTIPSQSGINGTALTWDFSTYFSEVDSGTLPLSYSVSAGVLPTGLSLSSSTGKVTGTPSVTSTLSGIVIRATNTDGSYVEAPAFSATIAASPNVSFSGSVPNVTNLVANAPITSPIDVAPYFTNATSYVVTTGTLPAGMVLNGSAITGTPTGAGITAGQSANYPIVITGSNTVPSSAPTNSFTLTVTNPAVVVPPVIVTSTVSSAEILLEETLGRLNQFPIVEAYGRCTAGASDPIGQIYRFCRVPSGARIMEILMLNDANPTLSSYDCGLYVSPAGGPVVTGSSSLFYAGLSFDNARSNWTNLFVPTVIGGLPSVANAGLRVWELLGMTSDPSSSTLVDVLYDVCMVARVPGKQGGNIAMRVRYLPPPPRGLATAMESPW